MDRDFGTRGEVTTDFAGGWDGLVPGRAARPQAGVAEWHVLVQNLRGGHYELAVEERAGRRLAVAFDELALVIWSGSEVAASVCQGSAQRNSADDEGPGEPPSPAELAAW